MVCVVRCRTTYTLTRAIFARVTVSATWLASVIAVQILVTSASLCWNQTSGTSIKLKWRAHALLIRTQNVRRRASFAYGCKVAANTAVGSLSGTWLANSIVGFVLSNWARFTLTIIIDNTVWTCQTIWPTKKTSAALGASRFAILATKEPMFELAGFAISKNPKCL